MSHSYSIHTKNREIAVAVSEILSSACVNIPNLDVSISHVSEANNDNLPNKYGKNIKFKRSN